MRVITKVLANNAIVQAIEDEMDEARGHCSVELGIPGVGTNFAEWRAAIDASVTRYVDAVRRYLKARAMDERGEIIERAPR